MVTRCFSDFVVSIAQFYKYISWHVMNKEQVNLSECKQFLCFNIERPPCHSSHGIIHKDTVYNTCILACKYEVSLEMYTSPNPTHLREFSGYVYSTIVCHDSDI